METALDDPVDHVGVGHAGHAAVLADVGGHPLQGHDGHGAGVLGDLRLLGGDDVHDHAALELLGHAALDAGGAGLGAGLCGLGAGDGWTRWTSLNGRRKSNGGLAVPDYRSPMPAPPEGPVHRQVACTRPRLWPVPRRRVGPAAVAAARLPARGRPLSRIASGRPRELDCRQRARRSASAAGGSSSISKASGNGAWPASRNQRTFRCLRSARAARTASLWNRLRHRHPAYRLRQLARRPPRRPAPPVPPRPGRARRTRPAAPGSARSRRPRVAPPRPAVRRARPGTARSRRPGRAPRRSPAPARPRPGAARVGVERRRAASIRACSRSRRPAVQLR